MTTLELLASGIDKKQDLCYSFYRSMRSVYTLRQQQHESIDVYYRRFQSVVNTAEMLQAVVALHPGLIAIEPNDGRSDIKIEKCVIKKYKVMILLLYADPRTYSSIWSDL